MININAYVRIFFQRHSAAVRFASYATVRYTLGRITVRSAERQEHVGSSGYGFRYASGCHFRGCLFRLSRCAAFVRGTRHQLSGIVFFRLIFFSKF